VSFLFRSSQCIVLFWVSFVVFIVSWHIDVFVCVFVSLRFWGFIFMRSLCFVFYNVCLFNPASQLLYINKLSWVWERNRMAVVHRLLIKAVKSHWYYCLWQVTLHYWHDKWCVRSSANVIMTSTFVSGPTAQSWHSLQLKQLVNNEILSYRASLTATFSPSWQSFVLLLQVTCWETTNFGAVLTLIVSTVGTGLTALTSQVGLCLCTSKVG